MEIEKRHLHFFGNIASTVRDVPIALGTPWIYPWGAVSPAEAEYERLCYEEPQRN